MLIRPATSSDVDAVCGIIGHHAAKGLMLPRSRAGILNTLRHYVVAESGDATIIGCGGLQPYTPALAEIYGLATKPDCSHRGTGSAIVSALMEEARAQRIRDVFVLTRAPGFFKKLRFRVIEQRALPLKVWRDCIACPKFGNCDEIAMLAEVDRTEPAADVFGNVTAGTV